MEATHSCDSVRSQRKTSTKPGFIVGTISGQLCLRRTREETDSGEAKRTYCVIVADVSWGGTPSVCPSGGQLIRLPR